MMRRQGNPLRGRGWGLRENVGVANGTGTIEEETEVLVTAIVYSSEKCG